MTRLIRLLLLLLTGVVMVQAWSLSTPEAVAFRRRSERSHESNYPSELRVKHVPSAPGEEASRRNSDSSDLSNRQRGQLRLSTSPHEQYVSPVWPDKLQEQLQSHPRDNLVRKTRYLPPGASVIQEYRRTDYGLEDISLKALPFRPVASDIAESRRGERAKHLQKRRRFRAGGVRRRASTASPTTGAEPRKHRRGSSTRELEKLYARRGLSIAPVRRSRVTSLPPLPPVYRNMCRRRRNPAALAALPAPLRSICSDFWASRSRHMKQLTHDIPHVPSGHVYVGPTPAAAAERHRRHRRMDSRAGADSIAARRRYLKRGAAGRTGVRQRAAFSNRFYKPYWPYKKNGRRYYSR